MPKDEPGDLSQDRTVIGTFTETWDAESALEALKFSGFEDNLRYALRIDQGDSDDTKDQGGFNLYFSKIFGLEQSSEYEDSKGNFSVNPEAEDYFSESYSKRLHVILIHASKGIDKAIDIIQLHHGKVDVRHPSFFISMAKDERLMDGETVLSPPRIHPTQAIAKPRNSNT